MSERSNFDSTFLCYKEIFLPDIIKCIKKRVQLATVYQLINHISHWWQVTTIRLQLDLLFSLYNHFYLCQAGFVFVLCLFVFRSMSRIAKKSCGNLYEFFLKRQVFAPGTSVLILGEILIVIQIKESLKDFSTLWHRASWECRRLCSLNAVISTGLILSILMSLEGPS